jgi:hypothetical protein
MKTRNVEPQEWWASLSDRERRLVCSAVVMLRGAKRSRILTRAASPAPASAGVAEADKAESGREGPRFVFRRTGRLWEVVFGGGRPVHLRNTLGTRYLDYLLHHPNEPISAFDLEVAIMPEKGGVRSTNSRAGTLDERARREYEQALRQLQVDRERAQQAGNRAEVRDLDGQIEELESTLGDRTGMTDTGERARGNVRKAIKVVVDSLLNRGGDERAFAQHIRETVSLGYQCFYAQPQGRIWE